MRPTFKDALIDLINEYLTPEDAVEMVEGLRAEASTLEAQIEEDPKK